VQRTRSSPSALRSPLTRHPLGGSKGPLWCLALLLTAGCTAASNGQCKAVVAAVAVQQRGPQVPAAFWDTHKDGVVTLRLRVGSEGSVIEPRVVSSPGHDYSFLALEAVKNWRYRPTLCDGRPIATDVTVTMRFAHE
jgi:TonB family protein